MPLICNHQVYIVLVLAFMSQPVALQDKPRASLEARLHSLQQLTWICHVKGRKTSCIKFYLEFELHQRVSCCYNCRLSQEKQSLPDQMAKAPVARGASPMHRA